MSSMADKRRDRKLLGGLFAAIVMLLIGIAVFTPHSTEEDPQPSTVNTGSKGARAALLTLQDLGRTAVSWDEDSAHIAQLDAPHATLLLLNPEVPFFEVKELSPRIEAFLKRGGHVLLTGTAWASILPGGQSRAPGEFAPKLCETVPEGPGPLAAAGSVEMNNSGSWAAEGPQFHVDQRCIAQPVIVHYPVGAGEAIWWSSASPLTNGGLKHDANLKLLLATVGTGRAVYFDQYYFGQHRPGEGNPLAGLPLKAFAWQFVALFLLLVWSFSRRKGPLRMPGTVPRTSPLEFAESMGGLYSKARATEPALEAAQRRLQRVLVRDAGLSNEVVQAGPEAIAETLEARFGTSTESDWTRLREHLERVEMARGVTTSPGDALRLVRSLAEDEERLRAVLAPMSLRSEQWKSSAESTVPDVTSAGPLRKGTASSVS